MNPLFGMLGGGNQQNALIQKFQQFRQGFQGDPKAEVMRLVQSGRISQQQLDQLQQMARQFQGMLK
jgi:hypothetical protein|uniref:Uncharacterized protein n=1 Tax=Siphoviridae sp. ctc6d98 TaxID=2825569 RepID=A0A8S5PCF4_9CAUD|nr:MAG TPA: hypothetical protein [Siphoviridae sp. ctc6d98]